MFTLPRKLVWGIFILCITPFFATVEAAPPPQVQRSTLPIFFEPLSAQPNQYIARGQNYKLQLGAAGATLWLQADAKQAGRYDQLALRFVNSAEVTPIAQQKQPGVSNYFLGKSPTEWQAGVPHFAQIAYPEIYPGVSAVFYGNGQQLEYDFQIAPGADVATIQLDFQGAKSLALAEDGALRLVLEGGELIQHAPVIYQERADGSRETIRGGYRLLTAENGVRVGFNIGEYDPARALIIDPVLSYSTYFGGTGDEGFEGGVAVDSAGNILLAGWTASTDFPTANAAQGSFAGWIDAVVVKLDPTGKQLLYSTYLGGKLGIANAHYVNGYDYTYGIAVDASGNAYVTGKTSSPDFPITAGAYDTTCGVNGLCDYPANALNDTQDAFVTKLSPAGGLVYSTFLGGSGTEQAYAIAVDPAGNAIVTGWTWSSNFPTLNAMQANLKGNVSAFVTKLNADGTALIYSTYLGGAIAADLTWPTINTYGRGVAVDSSGNAYVLGETSTVDFPITAGAFQSVFAGGAYDAFVTQFDPAGTLVYSTLLGGYGSEYSHAIAVDANGSAYVTGWTDSYNFPLFNAVQSVFGGGLHDAFVSRLSADGSSLLQSTYLGGSDDDLAYGIAVDSYGRVHVTGWTYSTNFPVKNAVQAVNQGGADAFLSKINTGGASLVYSTYLGGAVGVWGPANEISYGVALDTSGNKAHIAGATGAFDFPLVNPYQATFKIQYGASDAFVSVITDDTPGVIAPDLAVAIAPNLGLYVGRSFTYTLRIVNVGNAGATNAVVTDVLPTSVTFVSASSPQGACTYAAGVVTCSVGALAVNAEASVSIIVTPNVAGSLNNTMNVTVNEIEITTLNNSATDYAFITGNVDLALTMTDSPDPVFINSNLTYVLTVANNGVAPANNVVVSDTLPSAVSYVSATSPQGSCSVVAGVLTCALGSIANGGSTTVTLVVTPILGSSISNTMSASATETDANTTNNTVTIYTTVQAYPDLVETSVGNPPATVAPGAGFSASDTAKNQGVTTANASTTRYYLSLDTVKSTNDKLLTGTRAVASLVAGSSSAGSVSVTVPTSTVAGTYYLIACADDTKILVESNETNNCTTSAGTVQVSAPLSPDLAETSLGAPPVSVSLGGSFSATDTVLNQGGATAGASTTRYYLSLDTVKSNSDKLLTGTRAVPSLAAGASSAGSVTVTVPTSTTQASYYLIACADDLKRVAESSETNNCSVSITKVSVVP